MNAAVLPEGAPRDKSIIALVGTAHFVSHLMQLALAPLFPILHQAFGVGFAELGLVVAVFYTASGLGQAFIAGVLVDRYGAHRLLLMGLALLSGSILLMGLATAYWMLLPLGLMAGLGNSVFHPAGMSILSLRIRDDRLGRAFAIYALLGTLGYATTPVLITALAAFGNWRLALLFCGTGGLIFTAILYANRFLIAVPIRKVEVSPTPAGAAPAPAGLINGLWSPVFLLAFGYFALTAFSNQGVQAIGIAALTDGYGFTLATATLAITAYLLGNAAGIVVGGILADRTDKHQRIAMGGMLSGSVLMFAIAGLEGFAPLVVALMALNGMAYGITQPSRDIIIRKAAAGSGLGSVFGFVYSGFDLGSASAAPILGTMIDQGTPRTVFFTLALILALAAPTVMQVRRRARTDRHASKSL